MKLIDNFPTEYTPTEQQIKIINKIDDAFIDEKFVFCSAPTGSGKSFISKTIGNSSSKPSENFKKLIETYDAFQMNSSGLFTYEEECIEEGPSGSFVLTVSKQLQDQYISFFKNSSILKGKSNYICDIDNNFSVDIAPCVFSRKLKNDCWAKNRCPYYNNRNSVLLDKFGILNYNMFFSLPGHVKYKDYIICDEASELEDVIVKQFSVDINTTGLKKIGVNVPALYSEKDREVRTWIITLIGEVQSVIDSLREKINKKNEVTIFEKNKLTFLTSLKNKLILIDKTYYDCEYITQRVDKKVKISPLKVDKLSKYLFEYGRKILLMSATFVDHKNFAQTLGITKYKFIETKSSFDSSKAPIYISSKYKLNYKNIDILLPKIAKQIKEICDFHKNEKGIIHTHTNKITNFIKEKIPNNRYIVRDDNNNNEEILNKHTNADEPTILVSPSMGFGVDLKDELARFQIIVKAPFLPLNDMRVKKMSSNNFQWYINKMLVQVIQQCGRGVRNKNDFCTTYIIDGTIGDHIIRNRENIPKYFIDRFQ